MKFRARESCTKLLAAVYAHFGTIFPIFWGFDPFCAVLSCFAPVSHEVFTFAGNFPLKFEMLSKAKMANSIGPFCSISNSPRKQPLFPTAFWAVLG